MYSLILVNNLLNFLLISFEILHCYIKTILYSIFYRYKGEFVSAKNGNYRPITQRSPPHLPKLCEKCKWGAERCWEYKYRFQWLLFIYFYKQSHFHHQTVQKKKWLNVSICYWVLVYWAFVIFAHQNETPVLVRDNISKL